MISHLTADIFCTLFYGLDLDNHLEKLRFFCTTQQKQFKHSGNFKAWIMHLNYVIKLSGLKMKNFNTDFRNLNELNRKVNNK